MTRPRASGRCAHRPQIRACISTIARQHARVFVDLRCRDCGRRVKPNDEERRHMQALAVLIDYQWMTDHNRVLGALGL